MNAIKIKWLKLTVIVLIACYLGCNFFISIGNRYVQNGITLTQKRINIGKVYQGATVKGSFEILNSSEEPVRIFVKEKSCTCTTVFLSKEYLNPKETAKAIISVEPHDIGLLRFYAKIGSEGKDSKSIAEVTAEVSMKTVRTAIVYPNRVSLGSLDRKSKRGYAEISIAPGEAGASWREVKAESFALGSLNVLNIGKIRKVQYEVDQSKMNSGVFRDTIVIYLINDNQEIESTLRIPVDGRVIASVQVIPESIFVSAVKPGQRISGSLEVQQDDRGIPALLSSDSNLIDLLVTLDSYSQGRIEVNYEFTTPKTEGSFRENLTLKFKGRCEETVNIPVLGYVKKID